MRSAHFIGIEGIGMSGAARILMDKGIQVSGSDLKPGEQSRWLSAKGALIYKGHSDIHLSSDVDVVIASAAIKPDNNEIKEAKKRNIPIMKYAEILGWLMQNKKGIAVAGTNGKSTTSGMMAYLLHVADLDPSFIVGAKVRQFGENAICGTGEYFVAEACEYDRSFLNLDPKMAIVTNIEADHLDYYKDIQEIAQSFHDFASRLPQDGSLIIEKTACDKLPAPLCCRVETYSIEEKADWRAYDIVKTEMGYRFKVSYHGRKKGNFEIQLPGIHNVSNALSVIAMGFQVGIPYPMIQKGILGYEGVERRFEILATHPVTIIDDYAHNPCKVKAVLSAVRDRFPYNKVWCVFQPHQASRTYLLLDEFSNAFGQADEIIVTDIFYARDTLEYRQKISGVELTRRICAHGKHAVSIPSMKDVPSYLQGKAQSGDVILTIGAGNIGELAHALTYLNTSDHTLEFVGQ